MGFVEFETFTGRIVSICMNHIVCFQECIDVEDCGCKIRVTNGDWIFVKDSYNKVKDIILCQMGD